MMTKDEMLDQTEDTTAKFVEPQTKNKFVLLGNGTIQVWENGQIIYEGIDWKAAQLSTVPF